MPVYQSFPIPPTKSSTITNPPVSTNPLLFNQIINNFVIVAIVTAIVIKPVNIVDSATGILK